jgi:hypothetical protein
MMNDGLQISFYYHESIIGIGRGLNEKDAEKLMTQWEELGDNYWWTVDYVIDIIDDDFSEYE